MSQNQMFAEHLQNGKTIRWRPKGNSMTPLVKSGQRVTVEPVTNRLDIQVGDIVFAKVRGSYYLHLVKAQRENGTSLQFLIGNNHGHDNGWTSQIFGKLTKVEP